MRRSSRAPWILQNCPVFNDEVWEPVTAREHKEERQIELEHGKPLLFGKNKELGIRVGKDFRPEVVQVGDGPGQVPLSEVAVHDESAPPAWGFMLSQMMYPQMPMPMGVLYAVERAPYDVLATEQMKAAVAKKGPGDLKKLLHSGMTWQVGPDGTPKTH
jgi:2-oxoglutarate ferredoxin oxidoreductase subunit beta